MAMLIVAVASLALWVVVLLLPWQPWRCREHLEPAPPHADVPGSDDVTVLMPARDEAAVIGTTLGALRAAAPGVPVVMVDDQSRDDTAAIARASGLSDLVALIGTPPPAGWTGKLWALQQGLAHVSTPWVLLLDADIRLAPGMLASLRRKADEGHALVSVCAEPCWDTLAARWLFPAFVYFFKLLYPFALANRGGTRIAAAAGGVALVQHEALREAGAFGAWRDAIIDDCTLAAHLKQHGRRCWIGLTHGATSLRREGFSDVVRMIARSAFVQLRESLALAAAASALLVLAFWIPVLAMVFGDGAARVAGALAWLALAACYLPTLHYYGRNPLVALALPATASVFLVATWLSAWRGLAGTRSEWKGRRYRHGRA